jgi:succinyl-CoA synthetase beta subunit
VHILYKTHYLAMNCDAETLEINPLIETKEGGFVAVDARVVIDDNSVFRHPEFKKRSELRSEALNDLEVRAKKNGLDYVKLEGKIGVVGNGAGLVMATLDMIELFGGEPANFLDLGGGASIEKTVSAIEIVLCDPEVKVVLVNILGGITRGDVVAKALVKVKKEAETKKPIVIRLVGTKEIEGRQILSNAGFQVFDSMEEAAKRAVELSEEA